MHIFKNVILQTVLISNSVEVKKKMYLDMALIISDNWIIIWNQYKSRKYVEIEVLEYKKSREQRLRLDAPRDI